MNKVIVLLVLLVFPIAAQAQNEAAYDKIAASIFAKIQAKIADVDAPIGANIQELYGAYFVPENNECREILDNYKTNEDITLDSAVQDLLNKSFEILESKYIPELFTIDGEMLTRTFGRAHNALCKCVGDNIDDVAAFQTRTKKCTEEYQSSVDAAQIRFLLIEKGNKYTANWQKRSVYLSCPFAKEVYLKGSKYSVQDSYGLPHLFTDGYCFNFMTYYLDQKIDVLEKRFPTYQQQKDSIQKLIPHEKAFYNVFGNFTEQELVYRSKNGYYYTRFYIADERSKKARKPKYLCEIQFESCEPNPIIKNFTITSNPNVGKITSIHFVSFEFTPGDPPKMEEAPPKMNEAPPLADTPPPPPIFTFAKQKIKEVQKDIYIPWE